MGYESPLVICVEPTDFAPHERRANSRKAIRVRARITLEGEVLFLADTVDLSQGGLSITSKQPLNLEQKCNVEFATDVPGIAKPPVLQAEVVYCARLREDEYRIGLRFTFVSVEAEALIIAVLS
jgi:c-di-GMP-binding flagellar brake protein YcgR